jgi:NHL repeat
LRKLESKYPEELAVIGVHSGKYHAERVTGRILDASVRLGALHPVVNDRQFRVWRSYAASAWPTLAVIDPSGHVIGMHAGEFTAEMLMPFVDSVIEKARSDATLTSSSMHFPPDLPTMTPGDLRYPGKIAIDGSRIAIADSGNNRVLVGTLSDDGSRVRVTHTAGTGNAGLVDGKLPEFDSPQGLAFSGDKLFVADAGNHAIRVIDTGNGEARTLAGTGRQMRKRSDRDSGAMSSPWDVALIGQTLFVAMAGTHQIWAVDAVAGTSRVHSGAGGEDIHDGPAGQALLAQPMGITVSGGRLYFADSESSAVRWSDPASGAVETVVGTGLFDFGDVDGSGNEVRLQHPQSVVAHPAGGLLVADSYNDCIKLIDVRAQTSTVWLRGLHEPSGLACTQSHLYIADTNAHRIMSVNLTTRATTVLRIDWRRKEGSR